MNVMYKFLLRVRCMKLGLSSPQYRMLVIRGLNNKFLCAKRNKKLKFFSCPWAFSGAVLSFCLEGSHVTYANPSAEYMYIIYTIANT